MKNKLYSLVLIAVIVLSSLAMFACSGEVPNVLSTNATNYITSVGALGEITLESEEKLEEASALYVLLDETDKGREEVITAKTIYDGKYAQFEGLTSAKFIELVNLIPSVADIRAKAATLSKIVEAEKMYESLTPGALIASGVSAAQATMAAAREKYNAVKEITVPMLSTSLIEIAASGIVLVPTLQADIANLKQFFGVTTGSDLAKKVSINLNVYFDAADELTPESNILFSIKIPTTLTGIFEIEPSTIINKLKEANAGNKEINSDKAYKYSVNYVPIDAVAYYASEFTAFTAASKYIFHINGDKLNTNIMAGFELANGGINYNEGITRNNVLAIFPGNYNGCVVTMGFFEDSAAVGSAPLYSMVISIEAGTKPSMDQLTTLIAKQNKVSGKYKFAIKITSNNQVIAKDSEWSGFTAAYDYVITADSAKDKIAINAIGMVFNTTNGIEWGAANPTDNLKKIYGNDLDAIRNKLEYNVLVFSNDSTILDAPLFSFNIINYSGFFGTSAYGYDEFIVQLGKACAEGKVDAGAATYKLGFQAVDKTGTYRNSDIAGFLVTPSITISPEDAKPRVKFITVSQEITAGGNVAFGAFGMDNVMKTYGVDSVYELDGKVVLVMSIIKHGQASPVTTIELPMNYTMPLQESMRHYLAVAAKSNSAITSGQYFVTLKMKDLTGEFAESTTVQTNSFNYVFSSADEIKKLPNPNSLRPSNGINIIGQATELESITLSGKYLTKFSSAYRDSIGSVNYKIYKETAKGNNVFDTLVATITKTVGDADNEFVVPTRAEIIAAIEAAGEVISADTFYCLKLTVMAKGDVYSDSDEAASNKFTLDTAPGVTINNTITSFRPKDFVDGAVEIQIDTITKNTSEIVAYSIKEGLIDGVALSADGTITLTLASITQDITFTIVATLGSTEVKAEKIFKCFVEDATDLYWLEESNIDKAENLNKWVYWNDVAKSTITDAYVSADGQMTFSWVCGESPNFWSTQLFYKDSSIEAGKSKTTTMKLNSSVAGKITINGEVFTLVIGDNLIEVTNIQGNKSTVSMQLGTNSDNTTLASGTITITDLAIAENIPSASAILYGGETDAVATPNEWRYWNNAGVNVSRAEFASEVLDITWASNNVWYGVQLFYKDSSISVGTSYTVTMKVTSTVEGKITVNGTAFELIVGENDISVSTTQGGMATIAIQMGTNSSYIFTEATLKLANISITAN